MFTSLLTIFKSPITKFGTVLVLFILVIGLLTYSATWFYKRGQENIQIQWNLAKSDYNKQINKLQLELKDKEISFQLENERINQELRDAKKDYENKLNSISADYANKLHQSEQRISLYKRMSRKSSSGCGNLDSITSQLDRRLTEGIRLVRELSEHIRLRDEQLRDIGKKLKLETDLRE